MNKNVSLNGDEIVAIINHVEYFYLHLYPINVFHKHTEFNWNTLIMDIKNCFKSIDHGAHVYFYYYKTLK
jgi:hypothetical protein